MRHNAGRYSCFCFSNNIAIFTHCKQAVTRTYFYIISVVCLCYSVHTVILWHQCALLASIHDIQPCKKIGMNSTSWHRQSTSWSVQMIEPFLIAAKRWAFGSVWYKITAKSQSSIENLGSGWKNRFPIFLISACPNAREPYLCLILLSKIEWSTLNFLLWCELST